MKKSIFILSVIVLSFTAFAQKSLPIKKGFIPQAKLKTSLVKTISTAKSASIWSDDFSDATTWVIDHDASACDLDWQIGTGLAPSGSYPIDPIASTTYDNGSAMVDSDLYGGEAGGSEVEDSWITTASSIDLSTYPNVLLQFETWYRAFNSEKCFIVTSTNNTDWPELTPDFDATSNTNVYEAFPGVSEMPTNPTEWRLNISPSVGGESQVWVRFHWTGTWGYAWMLDDVAILEQPVDDVIVNSAWASTTGGFEYGRIPSAHVKDTLVMGTEVFNFGVNTQTNVEVLMNITNSSGTSVLSESTTISTLEGDSTEFTQATMTGYTLEEGTYQFSTVASSDGDNSNGTNFDNNSYTRNFEVTDNLFSIDGIGVYDNDILATSYIGTNWGNGTIVMARYELLVPTDVIGLELGLASFTDVGGQVFPFLVTEEIVVTNDMSSSNRIAENEDGVMITQQHIDNGIMYTELNATTLQPGVYYACVELYNGPNEDDGVYILDDETVVQPSSASMFYYIEDATNYTNGNAAAIRLAINDFLVTGCTDVLACNYTLSEPCVYPGENEFSGYIETYFDVNQIDVQGTSIFVQGSDVFSQGTSVYLQGSNIFTQGTNLLFSGVSEFLEMIVEEIYSVFEIYESESIFDCEGCLNDVDANNICDELQVGCPLPEFLEYNPIALTFDYTLCQTYIVYGCVNPDALNFNNEANVSDGTCEYENSPCPSSIFGEALYLPDGSGVTYSVSISIDCFGNGQILTDVNDIVSIDINMEHSYTGDLDMYITAPNGIQIQLFAQAGGGTWLGEATDQDATATNPGVGYDYGWSMNPTYNGTMADGMVDNTSPDSAGGFANVLNSDTYLPLESFEALLGTPLNGSWTLTVVDNLGIDNGWIFSWGISLFNDGLGCTDPSALNYNPNATEDNDTCEYETCSLPDYWASINTGANQTIMIPAGILINGENIPNGTHLGLFYMDDLGAYQSAGSVAYYGDVIAIPAMADDSTTPETDGLIEGVDLIWAIWDTSTCEDMLLNATYSAGPDVFTTNGISFVESFFTTTCQIINFPAGWFTFSTYIESDIVDVMELFEPIVASIVIVKNNVGMVYLPEWNYNGIGDINNNEGFQVKTYNAVSLEICGTQISPENNPLSLLSGWNLISYTREQPADVVSIVASLVANNNLVIVKNNEGMAYLPEWDYNGIGDMIPTQGYQLKINQAAVLEFLSNSETYE